MALKATAQAELSRLRRDIARIEGRLADEDRLILDAPAVAGAVYRPIVRPLSPVPSGTPATGEEGGPFGLRPRARRGRVRLGIACLDAALGGGLPLAALTEIRAEESRNGGAAAGFVLALAARLAAAGGEPSIVWISQADVRREAGRLHAPGLAALGLNPARIVEVAARTESEALWAFEAALGCRGVGVAVCELRQAGLDLTATRRSALRARDCGVTGFLLRLASRPEPSAAELRFGLSPAPAGTIDEFAAGIGRMAWRLTLEKNRGGPIGAFSVEWRSHERRFVEPGAQSGAASWVESGTGAGEEDAHAYPQPVSAAAFDRPADPPSAAWKGRRRYAS
jgi:protein ImuA